MIFEFHILRPLLQNIELNSEKNAFYINGVYYTYSSLGKTIYRIRNAVKKIEGDYIGLVVNDDLETYASIFALWLEGKCYVPLHPGQPLDRCMDIISQVSIKYILDSSEESRFTNSCVIMSGKLCDIENFQIQMPEEISDEKVAYILFTSGSTGKPKGVILSRKNVVAFIQAFSKTGIILTAEDRCLQCFDLTFDISVQSFLYPLLYGACVYTVSSTSIKVITVAGLIDEHQITFGAMPPSMVRCLKPYYNDFDASSIKYSMLVAEASDLQLVNDWSDKIPQAEIFDFYGPTEATIYCTYYKYQRGGENKSLNGMLSIGLPMDGVDAIIIDENKCILPKGEKGELCVSGDQLTSGYWKDSEKTMNAFFELEYNGGLKIFYRTGDLCCFDKDGDIMYIGRLDFQAKIQGFRVELGEIEYHAREFLKGKNSVAIAFQNQDENTEIALFLETDFLLKEDLDKYLRQKMPIYMIPAKYIICNPFPLNSNGKVDRKVLKMQIQ